jgi:biopolymer transport protein ExbB/TolQ
MPIWIDLIVWISRLIFVLLVFLSVYSWAIIINRRKFFKLRAPVISLFGLSKDSLANIQASKDTFVSGYLELAQEKLSATAFEKKKQLYAAQIKQQCETGLSSLATLGSTAPFIGLLGTVLSIIVSFGELSKGKGDMNQVMFSLAEALLLTAVGLVVAIPAVVAFNHFQGKVKSLFQTSESIVNYYFIHNPRE